MKTILICLSINFCFGLLAGQNLQSIWKDQHSPLNKGPAEHCFPDQNITKSSLLSSKTHKLDSIYSEIIYETDDPFFEKTKERVVYTYDPFGNVLNETECYWNAITWKPRFKTEMEYNEAGMVVMEKHWYWDNGAMMRIGLKVPERNIFMTMKTD